MEYEIRPYTEKDREAVRAICMKTAQQMPRSESRRLYLYQTSCDYYLDCEPENCFVAQDDAGNVVGYVLCAADCETYARRFKEKILPKLKEYSKLNAYFARTDVLLLGQFAMFFPAHMRLAVLPQARRQGVATALTDALRAHLTERRGKGILAIVPKKSDAAKRFFTGYGFSVLREFGGGTAFGLDL